MIHGVSGTPNILKFCYPNAPVRAGLPTGATVKGVIVLGEGGVIAPPPPRPRKAPNGAPNGPLKVGNIAHTAP